MLRKLNGKTLAAVAVFLVTMLFLLMLFLSLYPSDCAFAEDRYMTDISLRGIVEDPGESGLSTLISGGVDVLNALVTYIALPVAVLVVIWKAVFIGICTIVGVNPNKYIRIDRGLSASLLAGGWGDFGRYARSHPASYGAEESAASIRELMVNTVKGLLIVFCVWGILELIMKGVYVYIDMAKNLMG